MQNRAFVNPANVKSRLLAYRQLYFNESITKKQEVLTFETGQGEPIALLSKIGLLWCPAHSGSQRDSSIYKIRTHSPTGMCLDFSSKTSSADACGCCPRRGANVRGLAGPGCYRSTGQAESPVTLISWDGGRKKISIRKVAFRCGIIRNIDELFFKSGRRICAIRQQNLQTFASL